MKKLFLSSALFACLLTAAPVAYVHAANTEDTANTEVKSALNFGVCGGSNIATMRCNNLRFEEASVDLILPPHFGIWGEYVLKNTVGIRLALSYSRQGMRVVPWGSNLEPKTPKTRFKYNYLVLSPTLRIYPTSSRAFGIVVGPYIGYLLTAKVKIGDIMSMDMLKDPPKEEQPKRIDAGITLGLEGEHSSGIILGYVANIGLVNTKKKVENAEGIPADLLSRLQASAKNFTMKFYLGYNFAKLLN